MEGQSDQFQEQQDGRHQDEEDWWEGWRKKVKLAIQVDSGEEMPDLDWYEEDEPESGLEPPESLVTGAGGQSLSIPIMAMTHDELRILVQLDISVDTINLRDQFEWDLADVNNCPEDFACQLCVDLGLSGEFQTAISHSIREQTDAHIRSLSSVRHIRGDPILHDELRPAFQLPLTEPIRSNDIETWTPHLEKLGFLELDHREKERERQSRRQKRGARNNRRNVIALPDREPLRTNRTLMPKPGVGLDIGDTNGGEDGLAVPPTYEIALPYSLIPPQDRGPAPRMSSPLRRQVRPKYDNPTLFLNNGESSTGTVTAKPKVLGKKRGRPPLDPVAFAAKAATLAANAMATSGEFGNIGPLSANSKLLPESASTVASPVGFSPSSVKKVAGRPWKGKPGWNRPDMTTHPNLIDNKWHCTSK